MNLSKSQFKRLSTQVEEDQSQIAVGDHVKSFDFPGVRNDCFVEGIVTAIDRNTGFGSVSLHVIRDVHAGEDEMVGARLQVTAPLGVSSMTGRPAVVLLRKRA